MPHPTNTAWVRGAIETAGGADVVIGAALGEADAAIAKARRSGSGTHSLLDLRLAGVIRARARYVRTADEPGDALRALALAREATSLASEAAAHGEAFNEWLRQNGHRFMS